MKGRIIVSTLLALLLLVSLPMSALAVEWDIGKGDIIVNAESGGQTVRQGGGAAVPDSAPVITGTSKENNVTINADSGQTASVTLSGVNIDVRDKGKAAVSTTGEGNVSIELNGGSTLRSGYEHAGLEKNNGGSLTIGDENKDGKLTAEGGKYGAGIGGGMNGIVFQELRESRGLAYSAFADYSTTKRKEQQTNHAYTYIISQNDKMMDCIRVFNNILDTMPQSQPAFELAQQAAMKRIASQRITKANIIFSYLGNKRIGINYDIRRGVYEALPKLTLEDIVKFEHDNMANKPWLYLILGDEKNLDMKSLEKIAPIKRVSTEEIFGY